MKQKKKHWLVIFITPLFLLLLFPLLVANSGSSQEISETKEPVALSPERTLPFDPREVVEQSSSPGVIDPLVSKYTNIAVASDYQREPRVAYNSTNNTYLVVWEDIRGGSYYHIYGQRVDGNGKLLGSNIAIITDSCPNRYPDVAYNSNDNNWLVVWQRDFGVVGDWDIGYRAYNSAGSMITGGYVADPSTSDQMYPRVAYNSTEHNYCVVWQDDRDAANNWEVYSRLVTGAGAPTGSQNPVVGYSKDQLKPAIAYLDAVNGYLVAYEDDWAYSTTGWDISCKRLDKNGLPLTGYSPWVINTGNTQRDPEVAANTYNDNFLVVWEDYRSGSNWDIYGQRMSSADIPAKVGSEIAICTQTANQYDPTVCYSPAHIKYLVAWYDHRPASGTYIYGQLLSNTGTLEGGNVTLSSLSGVSEFYPHLAWNSSYRNFYLVQEDNRNSATTGYDIFGRKVTYESAVVTGMGYGGSSWYKAFDVYGRPYQTVKAFGAVNPNGEIDVEVADIWGDGTPEVIVAHGAGGASWIKIFNYDGTFYNAIKCFGPANTGGQVHLAVGDFAVGEDLEIAVATGRNGNNWVKVFETYGTLRANFKAYGPANSQGEVYLAAADFDGDGKDEIITGTGIGGNSKVKIFSGTGTFMSSFDAFGTENTQGSIHLAAGNFDSTPATQEIAVATGYGGTNEVKFFRQDGTLYSSFIAFGMAGNPNGSVHIAAVSYEAFGGWIHEILCGHGQGGSSWVKLFSYTGAFIRSFKAYGGVNANGEVYVSGCLSH